MSGSGLLACKPLPETHFAKRKSCHRLTLLPFQHSEQEFERSDVYDFAKLKKIR